jgi:hypothetical protein
MLFSSSQHLKMVDLLDAKATAAADPERQKQLSQFADLHRHLARSAASADNGRSTRLTPGQHMQLAALMHTKSQQAKKPENRKKLTELAEAHRQIAQVRSEKAKPAEPESRVADDATYEPALPFFKAGAAHFADESNDIKEMIRGIVRHLNKAGMSPEAIRDMKPYIVRFVEDVRSGKESLDGIPLPENGGDAGSEPEDVPPAAGQRGMKYSVTDRLPYIMMDDPPPLATLETWEQHLAELQSMPDFQGKKNRVAHAKWMIARKKRSAAHAKTKA